jgi:hypothetical protein
VSAPVFVVPTARLVAGRVLVDGPEGRHAATVTRLAVGEEVVLRPAISDRRIEHFSLFFGHFCNFHVVRQASAKPLELPLSGVAYTRTEIPDLAPNRVHALVSLGRRVITGGVAPERSARCLYSILARTRRWDASGVPAHTHTGGLQKPPVAPLVHPPPFLMSFWPTTDGAPRPDGGLPHRSATPRAVWSPRATGPTPPSQIRLVRAEGASGKPAAAFGPKPEHSLGRDQCADRPDTPARARRLTRSARPGAPD